MDLKPFEQLASWGGESYCMPRFQHLGRLLQFLNLNVTKNFGSISSLNHHLGWPTRWKIARNLLSLTWSQETCLTHLPHPSTVPCDCDRLVNVDTFTSLLFGWSFRSEGGAVGNCRGKRPFPNKKYWQALTSPKVKNSEFTPWNAMVRCRKTGRLLSYCTKQTPQELGNFLGEKCDAPRLRLPNKKPWVSHPKKMLGLKDPWFFVATSFLCKNSFQYRNRGVFEFGKRVSKLFKGVSLHLETNDLQ